MEPLVALALAATHPTRAEEARVSDGSSGVVRLADPSQVRLGGLLGKRYAANAERRLMDVDEDELLAGYRARPGKHPWIGEHVGKWLHAASLTYRHSHDGALRAKLDRVATGLMASQEADGYLGTYELGKRFSLEAGAEWDVWSHKYSLVGLLAYHETTGDAEALACARRAADLLARVFGPGGKSLAEAGTHMGMAATSVLEPVVQLYRATGDARYLDFAKGIVEGFEDRGASRLESDLLTKRSVAKSANGKAYEMLSNLVGLVELHRATGDPRYLRPVRVAWDDIVAKRLYLTGTGSSREHWTADGNMPDGEPDNVGETCVNVTWMQLNAQMLRLTGEAKYADQLERTTYNHLLGAQREDGGAWCYYTPLKGTRHPGSVTNCCLSSGPRGIAMLPTLAYATRANGVDVNLYGDSDYDGAVRLRQESQFPFSPDVKIQVRSAPAKAITIRFRIPAWAVGARAVVNGRPLPTPRPGRYLAVRRAWKAGSTVELHLPMPMRAVEGAGNNRGSVAFTSGPLVYAAVPSAGDATPRLLRFGSASRTAKFLGPGRAEVKGFTEAYGSVAAGGFEAKRQTLTLVPFFLAGASGSPYSVWLPSLPTVKAAESLLAGGEETQSRPGNNMGSFADGDHLSLSVTWDGTRSDEAWFAVTVRQPVTAGTIVYRHGKSYHDGGWFDTSAGKPVVQIQRSPGGAWEDLGSLESYPATDANRDPGIEPGTAFGISFPECTFYGARVVGRPSHGDAPEQSFASCAEIAAYPVGHSRKPPAKPAGDHR